MLVWDQKAQQCEAVYKKPRNGIEQCVSQLLNFEEDSRKWF